MLISDVHANSIALEAAFKHLDHNYGPVDYVLCAGDLVGIGPSPNKVCTSLRKMDNFIGVRGRYDQAVIDKDLTNIPSNILRSVSWAIKSISKENLNFLKSLKNYLGVKLAGFRIFLIHGSPENPLGGMISKVESRGKLEKYLDETDADMIVCGQTHVPFIKEVGSKYIINPGSVGQPKDRNPAASYVFVDIDNMEIDFNRVSYNVEDVARRAKKLRFPEELLNKIYFGR